jgi:hypothetical protein
MLELHELVETNIMQSNRTNILLKHIEVAEHKICESNIHSWNTLFDSTISVSAGLRSLTFPA